MSTLEFTRISSKGQIVIPKRIRQILKLEAGALFLVNEQGNNILLKKVDLPTEDKELGIDEIKNKIVPILKKNSVTKAGIFGSYARGEQKKDSDVDLLVEISKPISLLDFSGLKIELEEALGKKVDLVEYEVIKPLIKKRILKEEIRII